LLSHDNNGVKVPNSGRKPREERRVEIARAALKLLADGPVESVSTRAIARKIGLTQPGLFRHFRSRDEILAAVVGLARTEMAARAREIFDAKMPPLETIRAVISAILQFAMDHPGVPRLLFHDIGSGGTSRFHRSLRLLVSTQRSMFVALIGTAITDGELPPALDAHRAADLGVAGLQGILLQWQLGDRRFELAPLGSAFIDHWIAGLEAGVPRATGADRTDKGGTQREPGPPILSIDVRPLLHGGVDPAAQIFAELSRLPADGVMKVIAPFRPSPLLSLLSARGFECSCVEVEGALWVVEVRTPDGPTIADLRDLEAPEPLERILIETGEMAPGSVRLYRLPRFPRLLLPHLESRGLEHWIHEESDGTALLHLRRPK
jgi:AcrR family transcriptional regulator/uncharacterized protein (DUF2249 family)